MNAAQPEFPAAIKERHAHSGRQPDDHARYVVYSLPEPGQALPAIRDLAVRHVEYGVKLADYDALRKALLWALEQALGKDFTPAVREVWTVCYDELAGEMKAPVGV